MKISEFMAQLESMLQEHGDLEVVSGDYEEAVRRGRVRYNHSPAYIDLVSEEEGGDLLVFVSDATI